jgi:hypothetical protein
MARWPYQVGLLLLDVLLNDAQRCPATTGSEVGRRPQNVLPIAFLHIRPLDSQQPTGNAFQAVDQARHRVLRRVVDEQVYVLGCAVQLDQVRIEVGANFLKDGLEPLEGVSVKHLASILCDEDQMDMQCKNTVPAVA